MTPRSELCMAVESMFSYAFLYQFHGSNLFADKVKLAAFNALPAAMSPDCEYKTSNLIRTRYSIIFCNLIYIGWSHQYVTQTNQPWSRNLTANPFFNVVSYSNSFGLEPNFVSLDLNHQRHSSDSDLLALLYRQPSTRIFKIRCIFVCQVWTKWPCPYVARPIDSRDHHCIQEQHRWCISWPSALRADIKYSSSSHRPLNWTDRQSLPTFGVDARSLD